MRASRSTPGNTHSRVAACLVRARSCSCMARARRHVRTMKSSSQQVSVRALLNPIPTPADLTIFVPQPTQPPRSLYTPLPSIPPRASPPPSPPPSPVRTSRRLRARAAHSPRRRTSSGARRMASLRRACALRRRACAMWMERGCTRSSRARCESGRRTQRGLLQ